MKVDYHVHLEEGPYSMRWLDRTNEAIEHFEPSPFSKHTVDWLTFSRQRLQKRLEEGAYSTYWLDLYLLEALRKGIKEVGIVDHLYRFTETRKYYETYIHLGNDKLGTIQKTWLNQVMNQSLSAFTHSILQAKERWAKHGVTLRLGIEADYFEGGEKELEKLLALGEWDYIIGSVHFLDGWGFDNPETKSLYEERNLEDLYERFFKTVEKGIRSNLFHISAHLDNLKVFNYRPDENDLIPYYHRIAKALKETNTATEINAGLYYRYPVEEMCPSPLFLQILAQYEIPITLSSDSHFPDDLGNYIEQNSQTLKQHGFTSIASFHNGKRVMISI
ncbi:histidinol phosphate phosphatase domain-containing protein [Bacillus sp. 03113]|uniref:histidinol phosphate phosphatase domain-containing protein n=1 Tax=Bacillus sp. 03113 TaxID=2578211 RepID=UPI00114244A9|nr:histidinol phosphate phosphatase domain-containing protein [Bacillus sp. 03113]